jgi:chromosomal replication initiation ATPase DnaA
MTTALHQLVEDARARAEACRSRMEALDRAIAEAPRKHRDELDRTAARMRARAAEGFGSSELPGLVLTLLRQAARQHSTTVADILDGVQLRNVTRARWQVIRELRADPRHFSSPQIGRWLGLHHTSVLHALKLGSTRPYESSERNAEDSYDPDAPDYSGEWI